MKRLVVFCFVVVLIVVASPVSSTGATNDGVTCYDIATEQYLPATKWLTSPGTLIGTSKRDVLVGSSGSDVIKGMGGDDVICTSFFVEEVLLPGEDALDKVDPGSGNDSVYGHAVVSGSSGNDFVLTYGRDGVANGGSGADQVTTVNGIADGGSGNDMVFGDDAFEIRGGSGNDYLENYTGTPRMDCGSGRDKFVPLAATDVRRCETNVEK